MSSTRSSTLARTTQDAIFTIVGRFDDGATFEDVKNYVGMRLPTRPTDRTIQRYIRVLVDAGIIERTGTNNHYLYKRKVAQA